MTPIPLDSERFDNDTLHPAPTNLTGTVAKNGTATLTGTGTSFTTQLAVGDWISVPGGGGTEHRRVLTIPSNTSLTVETAFANTASGQTAQKLAVDLTVVTAGVYHISGSIRFVANTAGRRQARIEVSGTIVTSDQRMAVTDIASPTDLSPDQHWKCIAGDTIRVAVLQKSGGALDVASTAAVSPELSAVWVSEG